MLGFILLLAAPLVLGGVLLNNWLDDDDDEVGTPPEEDDGLVREGDVFLDLTTAEQDEFGEIQGTDGVDIVRLGPPGDRIAIAGQSSLVDVVEAPLINLNGGDDIFVVTGAGSGEVGALRGGDGDDLLLAPEVSRYFVSGGAGDDEIAVGDGSNARGDAGDDRLSADLRAAPLEGARTVLSGGDGDDVIELTTVTSNNAEPLRFAQLSGGTGADTFFVNIEQLPLLEPIIDPSVPEPLAPAATITDFEKGVDELVIRYETRAPVVEFEVVPNPGEGSVIVKYITLGSPNEPPMEASVVVNGAPDLTVDDVRFEQVRRGGVADVSAGP